MEMKANCNKPHLLKVYLRRIPTRLQTSKSTASQPPPIAYRDAWCHGRSALTRVAVVPCRRRQRGWSACRGRAAPAQTAFGCRPRRLRCRASWPSAPLAGRAASPSGPDCTRAAPARGSACPGFSERNTKSPRQGERCVK
jgi:hypothetical protein